MEAGAYETGTSAVVGGAGAIDALMAILRPFARLAVDHGVQFAQIEALLKRALLEAALRATESEGRTPASVSRLSIITGIHRKDVKRLLGEPERAQRSTGATPAMQVFTRWLADPAWRLAHGNALALPRRSAEDGTPSFEQLARSVTTDVYPRTLLDELLRLELVTLDPETDTVRLRSDAFVPASRIEELLAFAGAAVGDHLSAARANISASLRSARCASDVDERAPFVEQSLFADALSADSAATASARARTFWLSLLRTMAPELQRLEEADVAAGRQPDHRVRIGLYCFTEPLRPPTGAHAPDETRTR